MQKWEYCVVGPVKATPEGWRGQWPKISVLTEKGVKSKGVKIEAGVPEHETLAKFICLMGLEGWEMVGCGNVESFHVIYFKRSIDE